jgi:hypothetical protein
MPKRNRSQSQKESQRISKRVAKQAERVAQAPEQQTRRPCPTCVQNDDPAQDTHSRSSSALCPYHKKGKKELAKLAFNGHPELFTIKTGCERACQVPGLQREISNAVERIRDITYEAALLANRHFVRCMEARGTLEADCFSQTFFYACMKLVGNAPKKCPKGLREATFAGLEQTYASYVPLCPDNLPPPDGSSFWHALSASAVNMEKDARNHIVANFEQKAKEYIFFLLRETMDRNGIKVTNKDLKKLATFIYAKQAGETSRWPSSVDKVDRLEPLVDGVAGGIVLGPTPVTEEGLFSKPHEYMPFFFRVLRFFETVSCHAREPYEKTSPPLSWVRRKGRTKLTEWKQLSRTSQKKLVAVIRRCISNLKMDIQADAIVRKLSETSCSYLKKLVDKTRLKIRQKQFRPKMSVAPKSVRLFTLCPLYSCQRRFIEIDK